TRKSAPLRGEVEDDVAVQPRFERGIADHERRVRLSGALPILWFEAVSALEKKPRQDGRGSRSRIERHRADPLAGDVRDEEDGAHLRGRGDAEPAHDAEARNLLVLDRRDQPDVRLARSELVGADGGNVPRDDDAGGRLFEKAPDQGPRVQVVDDGEAQGVTTPATSGSGTPRSFWSSRAFRSGAPLPRRSRA